MKKALAEKTVELETPLPLASAIYHGTVRHRRMTPKSHDFTYRVFMVYLDLQELDRVFSMSPWWSRDRFNIVRYRRSDFFDGHHDQPLYEVIADKLEEHNGRRPEGPIRMLTNLRYWGFIMNPITCYYCFDPSGEQLQTVVAEVTNTPWRQRHHYILNVDEPNKQKQSFQFEKMMHVSPFQPMGLSYHWIGTTPEESVLVHIDVKQAGQSVFDATLKLHKEPISKAVLNRIIWRYPWMTMKVFAGIYWQACKLAFKRVPFYANPGASKLANKEQ